MHDSIHESTLDAFLDEALSAREMARIEQLLRDNPAGVQQLASICARRDAGVHSLGAIWRRHRLSCPGRETLGNYLLGVLDEDHTERIRLHLEVVEHRRHRYFKSSVRQL